MQTAQELNNCEWWIAVALASGFFIFIFWIIKTAIEARKEKDYDPFYEIEPCINCGNYTVWIKENKLTCDCCGHTEEK